MTKNAGRILTVSCLAAFAVLLYRSAGLTETSDTKADFTSSAAPGPLGPGPTCAGDATQLLFPLDGSYALVDFFGDGPTGSGFAQGPDQHNDDDSATVPLSFTFDLYGDLYTTAYVNNNGNLSFVTRYSQFTASGFPDPTFIMVAPFWADVDTGNPSNFVGDAYTKQYDSNGDTVPDTLVVTWDNAGYFNEHGDLRNTFQVAISDGTNPAMGLGNNVCFSYDNMCWTTGDASSGAGGFGGVPATVGANRGNGVDYFQIGRFDHAGVDYDGPFGNNDGVSYLDGGTTCFNTATGTSNISPIPQGFPQGNKATVDACSAEVLDLDLAFLSPEAGQTTTVTIVDVSGAQAAGLVITNTPGNVATVMLDWVPDAGDVGTYVLNFTATDDFVPPGVTNISLQINIVCPCVPLPEICDNGIDDDCDTLVDCVDEADCLSTVPPCRIGHDPSSIRFDRTGRGLDYFYSHGKLKLKASVDVGTAEITWLVSNSQGLVYAATLLAGDLTDTGTQFVFADSAANRGEGGLFRARIKVGPRGNAFYWVKAYGDFSRATEPQMTIQVHLSDQWYGLTGTWRRTSRGWILTPSILE